MNNHQKSRLDYTFDKIHKRVFITAYDGERTLTNRMPELAKHFSEKENDEVKSIVYTDSEGERTYYSVEKDSYYPLALKKLDGDYHE